MTKLKKMGHKKPRPKNTLTPKAQSTYLGIMFRASSTSAGHKFAICAVSNWVRFGSRRRVLFGKSKVNIIRYASKMKVVALSDGA